MAEPDEVAPSTPRQVSAATTKPVVVRVKRKATQARLDAFWLEINERPVKRSFLDIEGLSISDYPGNEISKRRKLLVQHVETISNSKAAKDTLQYFLPDFSGSKDMKSKIDERRKTLKQDSKQERIRSTARQKHEDLVRSARFQQIWNSRRGKMDADDESLREICHLYDVFQVDDIGDENSKAGKSTSGSSHISFEDNAILCNYLPLIRELIPSAAEEIESSMATSISKEDDYVYDLYTMEDGTYGDGKDASTEYPLVQVNDEDDYYDGSDSDHETDDSNAEDNPNNDYPDEESSDDDQGHDEMDLFDEDVERTKYQYENEELYVSGEEDENWRWGYC